MQKWKYNVDLLALGSYYSTQITEYWEQEPNFFGTLSFGEGHCYPMPDNPFLALTADNFSDPQSLSLQLQGLLNDTTVFPPVILSRGSLLSLWWGLHSSGSHSKPLLAGTSSLPPLSAPLWPLYSGAGFSFQLLTFQPWRRVMVFSPTDLLFILCMWFYQMDIGSNPDSMLY